MVEEKPDPWSLTESAGGSRPVVLIRRYGEVVSAATVFRQFSPAADRAWVLSHVSSWGDAASDLKVHVIGSTEGPGAYSRALTGTLTGGPISTWPGLLDDNGSTPVLILSNHRGGSGAPDILQVYDTTAATANLGIEVFEMEMRDLPTFLRGTVDFRFLRGPALEDIAVPPPPPP